MQDTTSHIQAAVRDAAAPISMALQVIYDGPQGGFRVSDVTFTYEDSGVTVAVVPGLPHDLREDLYGHFIDAFTAEGWGFSTRMNQERKHRVSVLFRRPALLTRTGEPTP